MDSLVLTGEPVYTFKVIGHQWFWSYEYFGITDYVAYCIEQSLANGVVESIQGKEAVPKLVNYSSYMLDEQAVYEIQGGLRLLEVDNPLFVPTLLCLRVLVTSVDVLHSWAVPSLGIKVDAVPGRINQVYTLVKRESKFYGQCSEICGVNHGFMPVKVVAYDEPEEHVVMFYKIEKALKDYNERRNNPPVPEEVPFTWYGFFYSLYHDVNWWPGHVFNVMYGDGGETEWPKR